MGGASTEIGEVARGRHDRRRPGGRALRPGRRSPGPPAGTSCPARRRGASSAASTRSCRRWRPSGPRGCSSSTAAARSPPGRTDEGAAPAPAPVRMPLELPDRVAGVRLRARRDRAPAAAGGLQRSSSTPGPTGTASCVATPPSWRPDLVQAADLVEEVLRLEGYDTIPSVLPPAPPGRGLTAGQLRRRAVSRALAEAGCVEVLPFPFVGAAVWDAFGLPADDVRRRTVRVANPLDADRPALATTLLPGLLDALVRNRARGFTDLALLHRRAGRAAAHEPGRRCRTRTSTDRPTDAEYRADQGRAAGPAGARGGRARRRPRAARLVGTGPAGRLGGRDRDRPARRAPRRASSCG